MDRSEAPARFAAILRETERYDRWSPAERAAEDERIERTWERFRGVSPAQTEARLLGQLLSPIAGYADATLDAFAAELPGQREALATVRHYAETWPARRAAREGLLLYGPVGAGKDHLAIAAAREIIRRHQAPALFVSGAELFGRLRDAMDGSRTEASIIGPWAAAPVLILSDPLPPAGALTDWQQAALFAMVDARYRAGRRAIVTINVVDGAEAQARMGAATWSRLRDGAVAVPCNWPDHRQPTLQAGAVNAEARRPARCAK